MENRLQTSEWIVAGSFLAFLLAVALLSKFNENRIGSKIKIYACEVKEIVAVTIQGAVDRPGEFSVSSGTLVKDVLKKSRPKDNANLRQIDLNGLVEGPLELVIPCLETLSIQVGGAVEELAVLEMPLGSRVCDLKGKVRALSGADKRFFKKQRRLKDGESLIVPWVASIEETVEIGKEVAEKSDKL